MNQKNETDTTPLPARIVATFGAERQARKISEECGELLAALSRFLDNRAPVEDVANEAADVAFLLQQLPYIIAASRPAEKFQPLDIVDRYQYALACKTDRVCRIMTAAIAETQDKQAPPAFAAAKDVLGYLQATVQISKSKLYKDIRDGHLRKQKDGSFLQSDVDSYNQALIEAGFDGGHACDEYMQALPTHAGSNAPAEKMKSNGGKA